MSAQPVKIAAMMYESRDSIKGLLGDRYPGVIGKWVDMLRKMEDSHGQSTLDVLRLMLLRAGMTGAEQLILTAAAVERIEADAGDQS